MITRGYFPYIWEMTVDLDTILWVYQGARVLTHSHLGPLMTWNLYWGYNRNQGGFTSQVHHT